MTKRDDRAPNHLEPNHVLLIHISNDLLVRAIDDELSPAETAQVEAHLSDCGACRTQYGELRLLSDRIEALAIAIPAHSSSAQRELLARKLETRQTNISAPSPSQVLRRFAWGMAIAAALALAVLFAPSRVRTSTGLLSASSTGRAVETFEMDGETFLALPYSNPDLPVSTSHIVEMQIPVSSLADAGVAFEPVSTRGTALDHSVLADVVVGMDGQPLGVHVLSAE